MPRNTLCLAIIALLLGQPAMAGEHLYVIAHPQVELAAKDVRAAFLGEKQVAGSTRLVVLDNARRKADFLQRVVAMDNEHYQQVWVKKGFRDGSKPPARRSIDMAVISIVKSTPGAIGYIGQKPPEGVKVLAEY